MLWWPSRQAGGGGGRPQAIHQKPGDLSLPKILQLLWGSNPGQPDPETHLCPPRSGCLHSSSDLCSLAKSGPLVPIYCGGSAPVVTCQGGREPVHWTQCAPSDPWLGPEASSSSCFWISGRTGDQETGPESRAVTKSVDHTPFLASAAPALCLVCLLKVIAAHSNCGDHSIDVPPSAKLRILGERMKSGSPWNLLDLSMIYRTSRGAC